MRKLIIISLFILSSGVQSQETKESDPKKIEELVETRVKEIFSKLGEGKITEFSKSLLLKEKKLKKEEELLELRKADLKKTEKEVAKKVASLQKQQNKIIGCLDKNAARRQARVDHLVKIVSGMKPQVAAEMLSVQESSLTVEIISMLDPTKISKIFNLMDKEISARLQKEYLNMRE